MSIEGASVNLGSTSNEHSEAKVPTVRVNLLLPQQNWIVEVAVTPEDEGDGSYLQESTQLTPVDFK